jgi:hypothetical protein
LLGGDSGLRFHHRVAAVFQDVMHNTLCWSCPTDGGGQRTARPATQDGRIGPNFGLNFLAPTLHWRA